MDNREAAEKLRETAAFYEMDGVPFKPQAYERAADAVASHGDDITAIFARGGEDALDKEIPGVGEGIAAHLASLCRTGTFPEYAKFKKRYPIDVLALTSVEDIGPRTVKELYRRLKVRNVGDLERAAKAGRIGRLKGFGKKTEANILRGIASLRRTKSERRVLGRVLPLSDRLERRVRAIKGVSNAVVAGSVRRRQETVGDIDIVVTTSAPERVMRAFSSFDEVEEIIEHGPTKTVARLKDGMHADVRVVPRAAFGAALQYFTGDKAHNVVIRTMAAKKGLKLNEYGLWKGGRRLAARTEADVYRALGMDVMPPELRTESGEIEAALAHRLPKLIPYGSLRGDLQTQTSWTDGSATIAEMAERAMELGLSYIAVTDHTRTLAMTGGLDEKKLAAQAKEIDSLNRKFAKRRKAFRILKGAEVNIMKDGSLDIDDAALKRLDIVGAAVHSYFRLSRAAQTARIVKAMRNPNVDVIFHPTGRLIGEREAYDIDMGALLGAAKETGTAMEIDAFPERSDLRDVHVRSAVKIGVKLVIDTDAHATEHLEHLDLGVAIARRGWAKKSDVLNTRTLPSLMKWLRMPKSRRR